MQIQLTQDELKEAVRLYVVSDLNINLDGKTLTTSFTATRGDAGVITNLTIQKNSAVDSTDIPGFTDASAEVVAQANGAVVEQVAETVAAAAPVPAPAEAKPAKPAKGTPAPVTTATLEVAAAAEPAVAAASDVPEVAAEAQAEEVKEAATAAPVTATTSLFG